MQEKWFERAAMRWDQFHWGCCGHAGGQSRDCDSWRPRLTRFKRRKTLRMNRKTALLIMLTAPATACGSEGSAVGGSLLDFPRTESTLSQPADPFAMEVGDCFDDTAMGTNEFSEIPEVPCSSHMTTMYTRSLIFLQAPFRGTNKQRRPPAGGATSVSLQRLVELI